MTYDAQQHLSALKPFQRKTVDVAFEHLHRAGGSGRFLVADEVGLGKTMVAKGVIAKTIARLYGQKNKINIVYVCSNAAIARQNVRHLNVGDSDREPIQTRLTLVSERLHELNVLGSGKVNFLTMTPDTAFDLKSHTGLARERALLFCLIEDSFPNRRKALSTLFRNGVGKWWENDCAIMRAKIANETIDRSISKSFVAAVTNDENLSSRLRAYDPKAPIKPGVLISDLRRLLARESVSHMQADLIILDEFQRFADLLHISDEDTTDAKRAASELAQALFGQRQAKLLLLSATPYRQLSLNTDSAEHSDHYQDFLKTIQFLMGDNQAQALPALTNDLAAFRASLLALPQLSQSPASRRDAPQDLALQTHIEIKNRIESILRGVIARTERVRSTDDANAMIETLTPKTDIQPSELLAYRGLQRLATELEAPNVIDLWKSAPYLLSFMHSYALKKKLDRRAKSSLTSWRGAAGSFIPKDALNGVKTIDAQNGRLRALKDQVLYTKEGPDLRDWLWIPPSKPTFGAPLGGTKSLIFSDWQVVPDALSCMLSHDANVHIGADQAAIEAAEKSKIKEVQYEILTTPSHTLAKMLPLGPFTSLEDCLTTTRKSVEVAIRAAGGRMRRMPHLKSNRSLLTQLNALIERQESTLATSGITTSQIDILARLALGSPMICAMRALWIEFPNASQDDIEAGATAIALGFRGYFNQGENRLLIERKFRKGKRWERILKYCVTYDLNAVIEEYVHLAKEAVEKAEETPKGVGEYVAGVLTLRPSSILVQHGANSKAQFKARYAVRFTDKADSEAGANRTVLMQDSFKSPFRPFILATTSIGQEGLDFHSYCARVVHWNLPRNPVDIEQREGRVHRYKNHAVRQNIALDHLAETTGERSDWSTLFQHEDSREKSNQKRDLVPYWIYAGRHQDARKIQRCVLSLPFSREVRRYEKLTRALANYRLAFGQPRQNELMDFLSQETQPDARDLKDLMIDLQP
jgi:hypothetical protein